LIGWSLGGIYARELARRFPELVRQVITLASPFRDISATNVPAFLRAMARDGARQLGSAELRSMLAAPLPVPSTAIYSRSDGIVAWQSCREVDGPQSESIEVEASHLGIGHHPVVLLTIADRLAQPEGEWRPFRPPAGIPWPLAPRARPRESEP
jgi:pimeloyl-ACP methyl ester carboxylesterase